MQQSRIILNGQEIEYDIVYKRIKSMYLRVVSGRLKVSVPYGYTLVMIEQVIIRHQNQILSLIQNYSPYVEYKDEGFVMIFDQCYKICLRDLGQKKCQIHGNCLYVYHHDIEKIVENYLRMLLYDYIYEQIKRLEASFGLKDVQIMIKKYKGRWGSCYYEKNKVSFNYYLIYLKKSLIDYVIIHELVHFKYPNHSKLFYQEVSRYLPDYRKREIELKGIRL